MKREDNRLCRLCLKTVSNEIFEQTAGNIKKNLEVLQLKLNFHIGEEHVLCRKCMENFEKCLNFKLTSLNVESVIHSSYNYDDNRKLDLREVYLQLSKHMGTADTFRDQEICRFCMKLNKTSSCKPLIELEEDMLQKCIPELNFNLTEKNLICDSCLNSLKFYFLFVQNCVDTKEMIIKECKFDTVVDYKRSMTKIKLNLDEFRCDIEKDNLAKTEIIIKNENDKPVKENMEVDIKINVEGDIAKVERNGESTEQLQEKEPGKVDFGGLCCETEEMNPLKMEVKIEDEDAEYYGDNLKIEMTDINEHVVTTEVNENFSQLRCEELKTEHEPSGVQTMPSDVARVALQYGHIYYTEFYKS